VASGDEEKEGLRKKKKKKGREGKGRNQVKDILFFSFRFKV
jgi:hypothetical protein